MTSSPQRRLDALTKQLELPSQDTGSFEGIPKIRQVAQNSAGP